MEKNSNDKSAKIKNFFHYNHCDIEKSVTSWFISPKSLLIFRGIVCLYSWIVLIGKFVVVTINNDVEDFFIYFTNLSFIGLVTYFTVRTHRGRISPLKNMEINKNLSLGGVLYFL